MNFATSDYERNISLKARPGSSWSGFSFSKAKKQLVGKLKDGRKLAVKVTPGQLDSFLSKPISLRGQAIRDLSLVSASVWG
jgi:hypothetical protein